ncbi:MAG: ribosomal RNA small subunit methyltransferase A [Spirochaetales bacterium]|nr:MAG: ribosomal RNA small subunit methyltransferase A [Spirochaetales bacterium]
MSLKYQSPSDISGFLKIHGLAMSKRFGQNFLMEPSIRRNIVELIEPGERDRVWEIGAGLGALTSLLTDRVGSLTVFEIDRGFSEALLELFAGKPGFSLVTGDFFKTWKRTLEETGPPDKILGNLPYNSASQIIADLVENGPAGVPMVFTVQKELAGRILAKPGTKAYSSFSVLCGTFVTARRCFDIQPGAFFPRPEVVSTVIRLEPGMPYPVKDRPFYLGFIRKIFNSRRKTLMNNLVSGYGLLSDKKEKISGMLAVMGIDPLRRSETLTVEQIIKCADNVQAVLESM